MSCYHEFQIRKANGKFRNICEPDESLKSIQGEILNVLNEIPFPECVHGFVVGRDIISNAMVHRKQRYVLNIDIKDFFGSVHIDGFDVIRRRLDEVFGADELSRIVKSFCFWRGALPQGAPTSPAVANIFMTTLDYIFSEYALANDLKYSRYADDLTFSGGDWLKRNHQGLIQFVDNWLATYSLERNLKKTKLMPYYQRQIVTGILVNNDKLSLPRSLKSELYFHFKNMDLLELSPSEIGILEHVRHVNPEVWEKICPRSAVSLMS